MPQRLKPDSFPAVMARLKPCPFKTDAGAEARILLRWLRHDQGRALIQNRVFPQAVKPCPFTVRDWTQTIYDTAEAVP